MKSNAWFGIMAIGATACAVLGSLASCAANLDDPGRFSADAAPPGASSETSSEAAVCPDVVQTVLSSPTCASAGCHSSSSPAAGLDLQAPDLRQRLAGQKATTGQLLIDPASPKDSVIYRRLVPGTGPTMPPGQPVALATIACIAAWIGASPSSVPSDTDAAVDGSPGGATVRVGSGRTTPYTDPSGNVWSADMGFTGGTGGTQATALAIANTNMAPLYNGERFAGTDTVPGSFSYAFAVPRGSYRVTLKFAETFRTAPNQRKFDVTINGQKVLADFDVVAAAGGQLIAVDRSFDATSSGDGGIRIEFSPGSVFNPMVNALAIEPAPPK